MLNPCINIKNVKQLQNGAKLESSIFRGLIASHNFLFSEIFEDYSTVKNKAMPLFYVETCVQLFILLNEF